LTILFRDMGIHILLLLISNIPSFGCSNDKWYRHNQYFVNCCKVSCQDNSGYTANYPLKFEINPLRCQMKFGLTHMDCFHFKKLKCSNNNLHSSHIDNISAWHFMCVLFEIHKHNLYNYLWDSSLHKCYSLWKRLKEWVNNPWTDSCRILELIKIVIRFVVGNLSFKINKLF